MFDGVVRRPGLVEYAPTFAAMQAFTARRDADTPDELWLLQHPPVYTLGMAGKREHLLADTTPAPAASVRPGEAGGELAAPAECLGGIPVVAIDRGGQVTYHGPGQVVIYLLVDLKRRGYGVRELVRRMEQSVIDLLASLAIPAQRREGAPGVYVGSAKIAALGLRVRQGCTYHGLALNVDMDLSPYAAINPCGYPGLMVTQLRDLGVQLDVETAGERLLSVLRAQL